MGLFLIIYFVVSATSKKLVCESEQGNITIMYNAEKLTGYKAFGVSYDFDGQKTIANEIGVEDCIDEFSNGFSLNTIKK